MVEDVTCRRKQCFLALEAPAASSNAGASISIRYLSGRARQKTGTRAFDAC